MKRVYSTDPASTVRDVTRSGVKSTWKKFKTGFTAVAQKAAPVARVITEAGPIIMELRGITSPMGVVTAGATAINATNGWLRENEGVFSRPIGITLIDGADGFAIQIVDVIESIADDSWVDEDGFKKWTFAEPFDDILCRYVPDEHGALHIYPRDGHTRKMTGGVRVDTEQHDRLRSMISELVRNSTGPITEIAIDSGSPERTVIRDAVTNPLPSPRADEILAVTAPMLGHGTGRCILLTGEPGTGKTSMATWIAGEVAPGGKVLVIRPDLTDMDDPEIKTILDVWTPDVVIIDDIDKLEDPLTNRVLETIRAGCTLTILTANNGLDEHVMDGSLLRCERVDETFEVDGLGIDLQATGVLKSLSEDDWTRVKTWPVAAQQEVGRRITYRGQSGLNLDEIESRIGMLVHSAGRMTPDD
jgi:hypothetical protein